MEEKLKTEEGVALPEVYLEKVGMTQIFNDQGRIPVTVLKIIPQFVSQVKTKEKEGYEAVQVSYYEKREKNVSKPLRGHQKKAGIEDRFFARSFEVSLTPQADFLGQQVTLGFFKKGDLLDVVGISKGKGFQGVMKRYNFSGGPAAHGSRFHRAPGSVGNRATPARIFPEKKMPGRMGGEQVTIQNLELVDMNFQEGFILVKGAIPGSKKSFVKIKKAIKA